MVNVSLQSFMCELWTSNNFKMQKPCAETTREPTFPQLDLFRRSLSANLNDFSRTILNHSAKIQPWSTYHYKALCVNYLLVIIFKTKNVCLEIYMRSNVGLFFIEFTQPGPSIRVLGAEFWPKKS